MSGRDAGTARLRGSNDGGLAPCTVVFVGGARRPPPGLARELLMALAQQFPGIGTSVTVPETFTPLFAAAGYTPLSLQQYEMTMDLADAKSA